MCQLHRMVTCQVCDNCRMDAQPRVVQRVLSPARAATRDRLIDATIALATEGGYDAVTIRTVAAEAGTSVPTVYQHAGSKDQLLTDALLRMGEESGAQLRLRPPQGGPAERITAVFTRILQTVHRKPRLYQALSRAWIASAPALMGFEDAPVFSSGNAAWIGETLRADGDDTHSEADLAAVTSILSCLFLGAMIEVSAGRDLDEVIDLLREASHRLLPDN